MSKITKPVRGSQDSNSDSWTPETVLLALCYGAFLTCQVLLFWNHDQFFKMGEKKIWRYNCNSLIPHVRAADTIGTSSDSWLWKIVSMAHRGMEEVRRRMEASAGLMMYEYHQPLMSLLYGVQYSGYHTPSLKNFERYKLIIIPNFSFQGN